MSRYCLDTSAYSHFRRAAPEIARLIDDAEWVGVPVIVLGELRAGFRHGQRTEPNERLLRDFLLNPAVEVIPIDEATSEQYADIQDDLRRAGTPVPTNDIWIAASAARHGATVVTYDDDFSRIRRIRSLVLKSS